MITFSVRVFEIVQKIATGKESHKHLYWNTISEHNEPSGCEAHIWCMCASHDEAESWNTI